MGKETIVAFAQQITGVLGSPSATTTIPGNQLPPPPPAFGGVINESAKDSKPWWPPRVVPPAGAPNVLLIMTDDQGYGVSSTFGGVIPTPALDRIAEAGLRYTQFHSTALCSPTRAALITGRNHHEVGFGVITELSTGFPGYDSYIGPEHATIGTILRDNGYATSWFGKNHNTPAFQYSAAGPFDQWPSGMGFEYFYGFMGGETDQWTPYLFRDHTQIFPWIDKPDYNLTTDMADEAIDYLKKLNAVAPDKPFFLYYVPGGSHSPHQPKKEWIDKFKGKFDMGWNAMRDEIFANQKRLGVIPPNAQLTPWPDDLPKWETLSADEKKLFARQAEVFAGYTAYTDHEIGRVIQAVEDMGKLDNTLIIYICGDNGTSPEGTLLGTPNQITAYNGILDVPVDAQLEFLRRLGLGGDLPAYGGRMVVGVRHAVQMDQADRVALRRHAAGPGDLVAGPHQGRRRHPQPVPPHHRYRADDPRSRRHQGAGHGQRHRAEADRRRQHDLHLRQGERRRSHDPHDPVFRDDRQPRHLSRRLVRQHDAAGPAVGAECADAGRQRLQVGAVQSHGGLLAGQRSRGENAGQAQGNAGAVRAGGEEVSTCLPLDNSQFQRAITPRPSATAGQTVFTYSGVMAGIPLSDAPSILNRSFTITAEVDVPEGGGDGMIVTAGGRFGGFGLYLLKGRPVFTYNLLQLLQPRWAGEQPLTAGKHTIVFDFTYDGPGIAKGGTGVLKVDGQEVAKLTIPKTIPFLMPADETFDIGVDTRTGVNDQDYQVPFRFNGTIDKLTFKLGKVQLTMDEHRRFREANAIARD